MTYKLNELKQTVPLPLQLHLSLLSLVHTHGVAHVWIHTSVVTLFRHMHAKQQQIHLIS